MTENKFSKSYSFSLIEIIFTIVLIAILSTFFLPKKIDNKLNFVADKLVLYLKYTRYLALIDNKFNPDDDMWFRERWTLKFQNCRSSVGGLYYVIYSDKNHGGNINKEECAKDPLTRKWIYSSNYCTQTATSSRYVLLTKEYGVIKVEISCNNTSTIGQISFGNDGSVYSKLGINPEDIYENEITSTCYIDMYDKNNKFVRIAVEPKTGHIYKVKL